MSELVERVARAIIRARHGIELSDIGAITADEYREEARAAIEAMREPTNGMNWAAMDRMPELDLDAGETETIWKTMISAALAPTEREAGG